MTSNVREQIAETVQAYCAHANDWEADQISVAIIAALPDIISSMVEPLVWCNYDGSACGVDLARGIGGSYFIDIGMVGYSLSLGGKFIGHFPTVASARNAASKHNATAILNGIGLTLP